MLSSSLASTAHLIALVLGVMAIHLRARRLGEPLDEPGLRRVLTADNLWGIAALLWIGSGLARLLWLEKSVPFYLHNGFFHLKMGLFGTVFLLELWPMATFITWRVQLAKGRTPDTSRASLFRWISYAELAIVVLMMFIAPLMARGLWLF